MLLVWHLNVRVHYRFYEKAKIILIVEDDADIGSFFVAALQQETPFHPMWVNDGFAALKTVHDVKPDLVILDYQLPHMNGIEVYDQLRARQELADVPALLMTAALGSLVNSVKGGSYTLSIEVAKPRSELER